MPDHVAVPPHPIVDGAEPKHAQLRAVLATMCAGELRPDGAIPSERELMETYAVSRATVRRAIESLVAEGVLRRVQGKGTFVAPPRVQSHLHLASFTQDMRRRGKTPVDPGRAASTRSRRRPRSPTGSASRRGRRPGGSSGCACAAGEPMAFEAGWYSTGARCPTSTGTTSAQSLYELFGREYGLAVDTARADGARGDGRRRPSPATSTSSRATPSWPSTGSSRCAGAPLERVTQPLPRRPLRARTSPSTAPCTRNAMTPPERTP